jgi:CRP-like cAMP-binding protein
MRLSKPDPIPNDFLAALSHKDYLRLKKHLKPIELKYGEILYEPGELLRHVYFPVKSLISLLTLVDGRLPLEVGMVGREGMIGYPLGLGIAKSQVRALVQGSGLALQMTAAQFSSELKLSDGLRQELGVYTSALMAQISQTAGCNRYHVVGSRLVRWLLMTRDRTRSTDIQMTHKFLGHMLGVRREGVTEAAGKLQKAGLITYNHGHVQILNEKGLEKAACACYKALKLTHTHTRSTKTAKF